MKFARTHPKFARAPQVLLNHTTKGSFAVAPYLARSCIRRLEWIRGERTPPKGWGREESCWSLCYSCYLLCTHRIQLRNIIKNQSRYKKKTKKNIVATARASAVTPPDTDTLSRPDSYYALLCATYKAYVVGRKGKGRGGRGSQKLLGLGSR